MRQARARPAWPQMPRRSWSALLVLSCCTLLGGCQSVGVTPPPPESTGRGTPLSAPSKFTLRMSQFLFLSDRELKPNTPLFQDLTALRDQVHKELQLPLGNTLIQVYLFEDRARYERFMKARYPELPKRRAFFVAQPRSLGGAEDLLVYTFWGDRVRQDLRHELTHALLHSVLKDVPLWLDEGLAEYFEVPAEWQGVHYPHLDVVRQAGHEPVKPDLARLEQFSQVQHMTPAEYREAWAWVHLLLRGKAEGRSTLLAYLQQLRTNPTPGPLGPLLTSLYPAPAEALAQHLDQLRNGVRPASALQLP